MRRGRGDVVAAVEACYRLEPDDDDWLRELAEQVDAMFDPGLGTLAYRIAGPDERGYRILGLVRSARLPPRALEAGRTFRTWLHGARGEGTVARTWGRLMQRLVEVGLAGPVDRILMSERATVGPKWLHNFFFPVEDQLNLVARDLEGRESLVFVGALTEAPNVRPEDRELAVMWLAHAMAGSRLRARLLSVGVEAPPGGAILDARGRVVHADGEARVEARREALEAAARRMDEARSAKGGRGPDAVAIWQGLVDGTWSLVETFDTDGRRFVLAHENPPGVRDPRALTKLEARVVALAVRGYSDKLIGYTLGIARSTAAGHLARAMRKLRIAKRVDLVRILGPSYPAAVE